MKHAASITEIATAIQSVEDKKSSPSVIYDMSGRRTTATQRGLYVIDGKKTAVK